MSEKLVSFIIPHKGRNELLLDTLKSIELQDFDLTQIEIAIVSQNQQLDIADISMQNLDTKLYVQPTNKIISELRNFGASQSMGKYLAFIDADIYLDPNWLTSMLTNLQQETNRILISAIQRNSVNPPPIETIRTALNNVSSDKNVDFLAGSNLFLLKSSFKKVKGFPEHLKTCEDIYFTGQLRQLGDLYCTSKSSFIHLGEDKNFSQMFHKEIWRGQSNLLSIKGRKISLSELPSFITPILVTSLILISCLALLTGNLFIGSLSVVIMLFPFMLYTTRLYFLAKTGIKFKFIFKFYLYYFPARTIGTLVGLLKSIKTNDHQ